MHRQMLFEARQGGYHVYRIPGLLTTPGGAVLASCEARQGRGGDWDPIDILTRRSLDGGRTWDVPRKLVDHTQFGEGNANNFMALADHETGRVIVLFCHKYARYFQMHSDDDGETFSDPVEITGFLEPLREKYPWKVIAAGPGHGIQLRNGRLMVPLWMSTGEGSEFGSGKLGHRPSAVSTLYSDDHGESWQCGELVCDTGGEILCPSEGLLLELADSRVLLNFRSESPRHRRLIAISPDGAADWSEPVFDDDLVEPICHASLIRLNWPVNEEPGRVLFVNPNSEGPTPKSHDWRDGWTGVGKRQNLTARLTFDDGRTWPIAKVIEPGPSGYSDLAVAPDGQVLCLFECGRVDREIGDDRCLMLARFGPEWIQQS